MQMTLMKCIFSFRYADYKLTSSHMEIIYHLFLHCIKVMVINSYSVHAILYMFLRNLRLVLLNYGVFFPNLIRLFDH